MAKEKESIYKKEIMEMWRNPKNFGVLENPTHEFVELNDLCGDDLNIQMIVKNGIVKDVKFVGTGCLVCVVSASELTEKIKGMKVEDIKKLTNEKAFEMIGLNFPKAKGLCAGLALKGIKDCLNTRTK